MNITVEQIITWVAMFLGLAGVWFRYQYKVERLNEKDEEQDRQIEAMWKWKDSHEKEAAQNREHFNKEISELRGIALVSGEQFKQIMSLLQDLKERMIKLENK